MKTEDLQGKLIDRSCCSPFFLSILFCIILTGLYTGVIIYLTWPIEEFSINKAAQFGSSFGGLSAIFSGLAFIGIVWTLHRNQEELLFIRKTQLLDTIFFKQINILFENKKKFNFVDVVNRFHKLNNIENGLFGFYKNNGLSTHFTLYSHIFFMIDQQANCSGKLDCYVDFMNVNMSINELGLLILYCLEINPELGLLAKKIDFFEKNLKTYESEISKIIGENQIFVCKEKFTNELLKD